MVSIVTSVQDSVPDFDMNILQILMLDITFLIKINTNSLINVLNSGLYAKMCNN